MFLKCYWTGESISSLPSTYGNGCLLSVVDLLEIQFRLVNFSLSLIVKLLSVKWDICSVIFLGITSNFQQARNLILLTFLGYFTHNAYTAIPLQPPLKVSLDTATNVFLFTGDTVATGVLICNRMKLPSTDWGKRNGIIFSRYLTPWFMTIYAPKYFA